MSGKTRNRVANTSGHGWRTHQKHIINIQPPLPPPPPPVPFPICANMALISISQSADIGLVATDGSSLASRIGPLGRHITAGGNCLESIEDGEVGVSDLTTLDPLSYESIFHNLAARYKRELIYTYLGTSLVSVNPYRKLALYTPEIIEAYKSCAPILPPHIFSIADSAHKEVWEKGNNQVVVAVGESGSGKSEALKQVLQYIAAITTDISYSVRQRLLQSNPLLEAFGNCRTTNNDSSSRFSKYVEIELDFKGEPIGGSLTCYMLQKSRITSQLEGGRNFHIFYQLLSGADVHTLKTLRLQRNSENYKLLRTGRSSFSTNRNDDKMDYIITFRAFHAIGFSEEEQLDVLRVIAAVLKLGNLVFVPSNNIDGTEGCEIENEYELYETSELLGCEMSALKNALKNRIFEIGSTDGSIEVSAYEASQSRNSLCRALYTRLFSWIVSRVNELIKVKFHGKQKILGLLDMIAFESLDSNGFQQLIINYSNEKMYQILNNITIKEVQEDYLKEGLDWKILEFPSNSSVIGLLELGKTAILHVIEDITKNKDVDILCDERDYLENFTMTCKSHPSFEYKGKTHKSSDNNLPQNAFRIRHYVGAVTYSTKGFGKENVDSLTIELSKAMFNCHHPIVKALFPEGNPKRVTVKRPSSTVSQAQISIEAIIRILRLKSIKMIFCIKPNELKQPRIIEQDLISHQIKYSCLLERSQLHSEGWALSEPHEEFLKRYRMLSGHTWPTWIGLALDGCAILLADLPIPPEQYTLGRTKVFIKSRKTVYVLDHYRRERLGYIAIQIQKIWRGWKHKNAYKLFKNAQTIISATWKMHKAREMIREMKQMKKAVWAAKIIQLTYISYLRYRLVLHLIANPPNESPVSSDWPNTASVISNLSATLKRMHHKWRCYRYRLKFDQTGRNRMREKVTSSLLFKDRKASYSKSVGHPFIGDYVRLRQNTQWKKQSTETNDQYVVFADMVNKVARSSGKFVPYLLVISTNSLLILDQRTLQVRYRIHASDVTMISLSPYLDDIAVLHIRQPNLANELSENQSLNPGCLFGSDDIKRKGDIVLQTCHIIEIVTKLFLVVQNAMGNPPEIVICTECEANFGQNVVLFSFKTSGMPDSSAGQIRIQRKHNTMDVVL